MQSMRCRSLSGRAPDAKSMRSTWISHNLQGLRDNKFQQDGEENQTLQFLAESAGGWWKNTCPGCAWLTGPTGVSIAHIPHFPPHLIVLQISRPLLAVLLSLFLYCM